MGAEVEAQQSTPHWSRTVRRLLYLEEGVLAGATFVWVYTRIIAPAVSVFPIDFANLEFGPAAAVVVLLFLVLLGRVLAWNRFDDTDSPTYPPRYRNWKETRRWRWVFILALATSGGLFVIAVSLGRLRTGDWTVHRFALAMMASVSLLGGGGLYAYTLHRLGVDVGFG